MINDQDRLRLNEEYERLTGIRVVRFVCPITLEDDASAELIDGHVLNQAFQTASRTAVIQRKDVDGYFGRTLEPQLVTYANLPIQTLSDHTSRARRLNLHHPDMGESEAFFAGNSASARFTQVDLMNGNGEIIASPFLRTSSGPVRSMKQVRVQWDFNVYSFALIGALLKSAYLALFRLQGYAWVNSPCGDKIRRALNGFFQARGDKDNAHEFFGEFDGCCTAEVNNFFEGWPDTLTGNEVLFHFAPDSVCERLLFALSCLFRINQKMFVVSVPTYMNHGHYSVAFAKYCEFLTLLRTM